MTCRDRCAHRSPILARAACARHAQLHSQHEIHIAPARFVHLIMPSSTDSMALRGLAWPLRMPGTDLIPTLWSPGSP